MAVITCLPDEVIAIILGYNDITIEDVINFRCVCHQFQYAVKYDKFMEKKLLQRWPNAKKLYQNCNIRREIGESEKNISKEEENKKFIKIAISYATELRNYLSQIIFDDYYKNRKNLNYISIDRLVKFNEDKLVTYLSPRSLKFAKSKYGMKYVFFIDETRNLFAQCRCGTDRDLIERYCNIKMIHYTKLSSVGSELDKLLEIPEREQLLEQTCTFLAQYIQPRKDICYSSVETSLDNITQEILNYFREKHSNHSIFTTSDETFSYWKNNNIDDNYWNEAESKLIMDTFNEYFFGKLNFRLCKYDNLDFEHLCIDCVLRSKYGENIIVLTIYHSVARRLGLCCNIIFNSDICIFWKLKHVTNNSETTQCFYMKPAIFSDYYDNYLPHYSSIDSNLSPVQDAIIKSKEMIFEIRQSIRILIKDHLINRSGLIEVKWNV